MGSARTKSQRERPLRVLNLETGTLSLEDVLMILNSNRTRRRTQKDVHVTVWTQQMSRRLTTAFKTPLVMGFPCVTESAYVCARHD